MNVGDLIGAVFMLLWGVYVLWLINKIVHSRDSLGSLFTTWPIARPKEFTIWMCMSASVAGLLCILLFTHDHATLLAQDHLTAPGTFIEYPGEHGDFRCSFTVHGLQYHGYSSSDEVGVYKIQQGYPFNVYYYPPNPNINNASEPIRHLVIGQVMLTFFSVLFMGVLALVVRKLGSLMRESSTTLPISTPS